jgi:hypothetical protein
MFFTAAKLQKLAIMQRAHKKREKNHFFQQFFLQFFLQFMCVLAANAAGYFTYFRAI